MNNITEVLKEAGRYDDILSLIDSISGELDAFQSYPVPPMLDGDKWVTHIKGANIIEGLSNLHKFLVCDTPITKSMSESIYSVYQYVEAESDVLNHNYANALAHRTQPETTLETLRIWLNLEFVLSEIWTHVDDENYDGSYEGFYVPEGWKKKDMDDQDESDEIHMLKEENKHLKEKLRHLRTVMNMIYRISMQVKTHNEM